MESDPNDEEPARPVAAAKQKYSGNESQNSNETNPKQIGLQGAPRIDFGHMIKECNAPDQNKDPTDDRYGKGTPIHSARPSEYDLLALPSNIEEKAPESPPKLIL